VVTIHGTCNVIAHYGLFILHYCYYYYYPFSLFQNNLAGSQNSNDLTDLALLISVLPNFLVIRHVSSITAFCIRIYTAGLRLSGFKVSCNLLEIIPVADNTSVNMQAVFSCRIFKTSSFKAVCFVEFLGDGAVEVVTVRS
jgi:hypothetical protein